MASKRLLVILCGVCTGTLMGCATRQYVDDQLNKALTSEMGPVRMEISEMKTGLTASREDIEKLKSIDQKQEERLEKGLSLVDEALNRANEAHKLARGKLIYEVTISDESVPFAYRKSKLSEEARASLDMFAKVLLDENRGVFIEIQGHTDTIGSKTYNHSLGLARAEAVRDHLYLEHGIPLHRMSIFSYGESKPVAPNDSDENRAKNRRVMLMVMQ